MNATAIESNGELRDLIIASSRRRGLTFTMDEVNWIVGLLLMTIRVAAAAGGAVKSSRELFAQREDLERLLRRAKRPDTGSRVVALPFVSSEPGEAFSEIVFVLDATVNGFEKLEEQQKQKMSKAGRKSAEVRRNEAARNLRRVHEIAEKLKNPRLRKHPTSDQAIDEIIAQLDALKVSISPRTVRRYLGSQMFHWRRSMASQGVKIAGHEQC